MERKATTIGRPRRTKFSRYHVLKRVSEAGAALVEYAVLVTFIAMVSLASLSSLSGAVGAGMCTVVFHTSDDPAIVWARNTPAIMSILEIEYTSNGSGYCCQASAAGHNVCFN